MNTAEENDVILTKRIRVLNNRRRTESQLEPLIILSASESLVNIMCGVMTHYYTCTHTSSNSKTKSKTPQQRTYEAQCRNASKCVWCSECAAYMLYESYAVRVSEGIKLMSKNNTIYSKRSRARALLDSKGMHWKVFKQHNILSVSCVWVCECDGSKLHNRLRSR